MEFELSHAHQQIRLGEIQASKHQWTIAIEYYIRAIEYFKIIQNNLIDSNLISIIQVQIIQCEKTIDLYRLKDQFEQSFFEKIKNENLFKLNSSTKSNRIKSNDDNINSLSILIFPKILAKKIQKHDADKIEELQISYEALKNHLKAAFDDIERLKYENNQLRIQQESTNSNDDEEDPETELKATL